MLCISLMNCWDCSDASPEAVASLLLRIYGRWDCFIKVGVVMWCAVGGKLIVMGPPLISSSYFFSWYYYCHVKMFDVQLADPPTGCLLWHHQLSVLASCGTVHPFLLLQPGETHDCNLERQKMITSTINWIANILCILDTAADCLILEALSVIECHWRQFVEASFYIFYMNDESLYFILINILNKDTFIIQLTAFVSHQSC
jgi:hypothetical protein